MVKSFPFRLGVVIAGLCVAVAGVRAQTSSMGTLRVSVMIVDAELNVKPVPRHVLMVQRADGTADPIRVVVGFDGKVEQRLAPGMYTVESERPVDFQGHSYRWKQTVTIRLGDPTVLELSVDNASDERTAPGASRPAAPPAPPPPPAAPDVRGMWEGSYADSPGSRLTIDKQDGTAFSGTLTVPNKPGQAPTEIQVEGKVTQQAIELREIRVVSLGAAQSWGLGAGTGSLQSDGRQMSGTGRDARSSYKWSFARRDASSGGGSAMPPSAPPSQPAPPPPMMSRPATADMRGTWEGLYAEVPAQLTISRQDGGNFSGTLVVTTAQGREPSEVEITGTISDQGIELRESKLIKMGAAPSWNLASGTGTMSSDGAQISGSGRDGRTTYKWQFTRRGAPPPSRDMSPAPMPMMSAAASGLDLRGTWEGKYADAGATLVIDTMSGNGFSGTLTLTTRPGRANTEIHLEGTVSGTSVEVRETKLISAGAAGNWRLGSGSGMLQGNQMSGNGSDGKSSYRFTFTRK